MAPIFKNACKIAGVIAAVVLPLIASRPGHSPSPVLRFDFLDVGQGDAILITSPSGFQILIDGGPDQAVLGQLRSAMDASDRYIDMIILSHPDADHLTGLVDVLRDYQTKRVFMPDVSKETSLYRAWNELLAEHSVEVNVVSRPHTIRLPDGIALHMIHPGPQTFHHGEAVNDASIVIRLEYGRRSFLFTGDIESEIEERLVKDWLEALDADMLKAPHHGSDSSSTPAFLKAVSPALSVIQVGKQNKYGHPSPIVLDRYRRQSIDVWRNDTEGSIRFETDGAAMWKTGDCLISIAFVFPCKPEKVYTFSHEN